MGWANGLAVDKSHPSHAKKCVACTNEHALRFMTDMSLAIDAFDAYGFNSCN